LNCAWCHRRIWSNSTSLGVIFPCGGGVLVAISCIFERRRARFSYFHKSDDDGLKIRKPGMPGFLGISPRQTTKAHVLYVPGVNLQLITQERDHKDPSQITAPHMTFGRTVCKTAVIFCQVNALFIAQLSCHVFDSGVCMHASRQRQRGSSIRQPRGYGILLHARGRGRRQSVVAGRAKCAQPSPVPQLAPAL
jgi:hypothetical protein